MTRRAQRDRIEAGEPVVDNERSNSGRAHARGQAPSVGQHGFQRHVQRPGDK